MLRRAGVSVLGAIAVAGGLGCQPSPNSVGAAAPAGRGSSAAPSQPYKVVVLRIGGVWADREAPDQDVKDGLRSGGLTDSRYVSLISRDAKGEIESLPAMVKAAVNDGADLIVTLAPASTLAASAGAGKVPVVFGMGAEPVPLGLGESNGSHPATITGAYVPYRESDLFIIVATTIAQGKSIGLLVNPADKLSTSHRDALLRSPGAAELLKTAEYRDGAGALSAAKELLAKGVGAIVLTNGLGASAPGVIAEAKAAKAPCFGTTIEEVRAGAVLARVPLLRYCGFEAGRRAARVLQGESPGNIPFSAGSTYATYLNGKVIKELDVKLPGAVLRDVVDVSKEQP